MPEFGNYGGYPHWAQTLALPRLELMYWTGSPTFEHFLLVGDAWAHFICSCRKRFLIPEQCHVLDIGCGCAKTARHLAHNPHLTYVGFDIMKDAINWCNQTFVDYADRFRFVHFDGVSQHYNPGGTIRAEEYVFPCEDRSVDIAFAASVFTHLFEADARRYLQETARVVRPGGLALMSIHDLPAPEMGFAGNEKQIFVSPDYLNAIAAEHGLDFAARNEDLCGQQVQIFVRR